MNTEQARLLERRRGSDVCPELNETGGLLATKACCGAGLAGHDR